MKLHRILKDRTAIRILKMLYDQEAMKKGYAMKLSYAKNRLGMVLSPGSSVELLSKFSLVGIDHVGNDMVMSITNKGKEFIEIFDQLVEIFAGKEGKEGKAAFADKVKVRYELTMQEKRIIVLCYKISKEIGRDFVALKTLVEELYPNQLNQTNKTSTVSRYISRLEEIKLMEKKKEGRNSYVKVTEKGLKTIKEQYLNGLMH